MSDGPKRMSIGVADTRLDLLKSSDVLRSGKANVLSFSHLKHRLGNAWTRKRDLVWDFVERRSRELGGPGAISLRVSDSDLLLVLADSSGKRALSTCLRVAEATHVHFLGAFSLADLTISRVCSFSGDQIEVADVEFSDAPQESDEDVAISMRAQKRGADLSKNPAFLRTLSGFECRIDFLPRAIVSLKTGGAAGVYIEREIRHGSGEVLVSQREIDALADPDLAQIDIETMVFARNFLPETGAPAPFAVMVPVSYRTLLWRRGRERLLAPSAGKPEALILEMRDTDAGTLESRLIEAVALVAPATKAVFIRQPHGAVTFPQISRAKFGGVTVDVEYLNRLSASRGLTPQSVVARLKMHVALAIAMVGKSESTAEQLAALGFTHRCGWSR